MSDTKKASSTPKTLIDKIIHSIRAQPSGPNGVSRTAIAKYCQSEFDVDKSKANQLKSALKKGVEKGILTQTGQSFRVTADPAPAAVEVKVKIEDVKVGTGPAAESGDTVIVKYEGKLDDGTVFDSASKFDFTLGAGEVIKGNQTENFSIKINSVHCLTFVPIMVIKGWDIGVDGMKVGGVRKLFVPSKFGYGKRGAMPEIPPNADLHFTVTLKEIR